MKNPARWRELMFINSLQRAGPDSYKDQLRELPHTSVCLQLIENTGWYTVFV